MAVQRVALWLCVVVGAVGVGMEVYRFLRPLVLPGAIPTGMTVFWAVVLAAGYMLVAETVVKAAPQWWQAKKETIRETRTLIAFAEITGQLEASAPSPHLYPN